MGRLFGTDGVRGIANTELTPELAFSLGRAAAFFVSHGNGQCRVIIGKDTRLSGDMVEASLVSGICSVGGHAVRVGVVTTPGLAYLVGQLGAEMGAMISASHNPAEYNGIKFFSRAGYKIPDELELRIERAVLERMEYLPRPSGTGVGTAAEFPGAVDRYVDHLARLGNGGFKGIKAVVDCANGSASSIAPRVLEQLGVEVIPINDAPDGSNINRGCGSTSPEGLMRSVLEHGADVGFAHDGDADRTLAVDEKGRLVDGDQILTMCALYMMDRGLLRQNTVVATVMSNMGLEVALLRRGGRLLRTRVGDRYVLEAMLAQGFNLGGEQSGHIIFLDHATTGDGLLTALQILKVMRDTGMPLSELAGRMEKFPQVLLNVPVEDREGFEENPAISAAIDSVRKRLGEYGRVLVRPSGTEPVIRVMVEGADEDAVRSAAEELAWVLKSELSGGDR